ncbi:MAG: hypothetical protein JRD89_00725 [Deltaproteobacteria bacterium]|nr:hypothetical protein [Deltaproteobacteria bacterium]
MGGGEVVEWLRRLREKLFDIPPRMGAPTGWRRTGHVWWMDDFEADGLHWDTDLVGFNADVDLDIDYAHSGQQSVKLTTGEQTYGYAKIYRVHMIPDSSKLGFEFWWRFGTGIEYIEMDIDIDDLSKYYMFGVRLNVPTNTVQLRTTENAYVDVTRLYWDTGYFKGLKLVLDPASGKYDKLYFSEEEHDISSFQPHWIASQGASLLGVNLMAKNYTTGNHNAWIDDVILTYDED